jgi:AcrR family transcriptional regulator
MMSDRPSAPPRKQRSRSYHHGNLRSALLEAAFEELGVTSLRELSLRNLAGRVGVSHAAPYRHFRNKGALLSALGEEGHRSLRDAISGAVALAPPGAQSGAHAAALAYVRFALESPSRYALLLGEESGAMREAAGATFDLLGRVVAVEGRSPNAQRALGTLVWALLHGLAELCFARHVDAGDRDALDRLLVVATGQLVELSKRDGLDELGALLDKRRLAT